MRLTKIPSDCFNIISVCSSFRSNMSVCLLVCLCLFVLSMCLSFSTCVSFLEGKQKSSLKNTQCQEKRVVTTCGCAMCRVWRQPPQRRGGLANGALRSVRHAPSPPSNTTQQSLRGASLYSLYLRHCWPKQSKPRRGRRSSAVL